ncbi:hypothetical protein R84981_001885 [Carnimonas sp. R-84981]|uniref:DUF2946 domain-containing protein n=1 Tax=Carnimonas bestiolae TaxID=3402172 RepID=UPI003EDBB03C
MHTIRRRYGDIAALMSLLAILMLFIGPLVSRTLMCAEHAHAAPAAMADAVRFDFPQRGMPGASSTSMAAASGVAERAHHAMLHASHASHAHSVSQEVASAEAQGDATMPMASHHASHAHASMPSVSHQHSDSSADWFDLCGYCSLWQHFPLVHLTLPAIAVSHFPPHAARVSSVVPVVIRAMPRSPAQPRAPPSLLIS